MLKVPLSLNIVKAYKKKKIRQSSRLWKQKPGLGAKCQIYITRLERKERPSPMLVAANHTGEINENGFQ
jgi:1-acyl-sn-glycerol-3-phosphate acyltransferase